MTGDLREKRAGYALDGKGKGNVLYRAFMADFGEHIDKALGLFFGQSLKNIINVARGIAVFCGYGNQFFRVGSMRQQFYFHMFILSCRTDALE